jgi:hypothetical protein
VGRAGCQREGVARLRRCNNSQERSSQEEQEAEMQPHAVTRPSR